MFGEENKFDIITPSNACNGACVTLRPIRTATKVGLHFLILNRHIDIHSIISYSYGVFV